MPRLTINPGAPGALEIQLKPGINSLGRGTANDFKIENLSVSGSHCQIVVEPGRTVIRDLGSTNGTFVNRAPVKEAVLQSGQTIHLASVEVLFHEGPAPAQAARQTEILAAPIIPVATAIPVQAKPIVATPVVPSAPAPIVAIPVAPRPIAAMTATPVAPAPIVVTPVPPPGAPPPIKPFPLPGASAPAIPAVPAQTAVSVATPVAIPAARPVAPVPAGTAIPMAAAIPTAAPAVPIELPPKPYAPPSALRISGSSHTVVVEAPPPIPEQPAADEPPVPATGPAYCKHHPKTLGRFFCNSCHQFYCDMCVGSRHVGGTKVKTCRHCGIEVGAVQVKFQKPVQIGFFKRIPGSFGYPLRGAGVIIMLVGIVLTMILRFGQWMFMTGSARPMIFGVMLQVFAGGYLFTYLQSIIFSTVAEDKELPDLPGISSFVEDVVFPFLRLLGLIVCCFGPAIALEIWAVVSGEPSGPLAIAILATAILGGLYFPMAFLAVATLDSLPAANPLIVLPSMLKVPVEYFATVVLLGCVLGFRRLGDFLIGVVFPRGWTTHSMGELFAMIGGLAFWGFLGFYLLIVTVHILGLLYVSKKDKLGWLDR